MHAPLVEVPARRYAAHGCLYIPGVAKLKDYFLRHVSVAFAETTVAKEVPGTEGTGSRQLITPAPRWLLQK